MPRRPAAPIPLLALGKNGSDSDGLGFHVVVATRTYHFGRADRERADRIPASRAIRREWADGRFARDRAEFDQFMNDRHNRPADHHLDAESRARVSPIADIAA
jgi:hypothetical protein